MMKAVIYSLFFCFFSGHTSLFSQLDFIASPHVIKAEKRSYYEYLKDTYLVQTTKDFGLKGNVKSIKDVEMDTLENVKEIDQYTFFENNKLVYYQKGDTLQGLLNSDIKYATFIFDEQQDKLLEIDYFDRSFGSTNKVCYLLNKDGYVEKYTSQRSNTNNQHSKDADDTVFYHWHNNYTKLRPQYKFVTDKKDKYDELETYQFKFDKNGLVVLETEEGGNEKYALTRSIGYDSILKLPTSILVKGGNIFVWDFIFYNEKGLVTGEERHNHTIQSSSIHDNCSKQYKYNEHDDLIEITTQCKGDGVSSKGTIHYSGYDEYGNWTIKRAGSRIYQREILYYK